MAIKLTAKEKMLNTLKKTEGYNTFTTKQAQHRFGIKNVSARIDELRKEGHCIYTNTRMVNGNKISFYRLGTPTKELVQFALAAGYKFNA
ncbi:Helix-turn-helix domain containing protein [uncultured Caudovirales phage]|uniref:Helix-turn-helix domain containing protein n=1 Tax=uncultured Caudovirales phage TaxID=2100421 RepID=A0A6J5LFH2_9CAUD|nr:Helix-turn-helix domain containing protein [uncultured Caudovirales phage]